MTIQKLFDVIYEDAEFLVINKPAGLVCHPTKTDEYSSLISRARLYLGQRARPQLINRLDRETSGTTLLAKNHDSARKLRRLWEDRMVTKEYLAIVHGQVRQAHQVITAPLGKDESSVVAIKDCVRPDGAESQTEFWVESSFSKGIPMCEPAAESERGVQTVARANGTADDSGASGAQPAQGSLQPNGCTPPGTCALARSFSLLRVLPHTGRKHQIRIHLAHIGHPIVGDKIYGGDEDLYLALVENRLTEEQRSRLILPHHALHAAEVRFRWGNHERVFRAEPEPWFRAFCSQAPVTGG